MEKMTIDQKTACFLSKHIENPCVEPKTGLNIRQFYINEAKRIIETSKDPLAIKILEISIRKYSIE